MKFYKTVLMPIKVPVGNYCRGDKRICDHFDNEGGHPTCDLNFRDIKYDRKTGYVPKPTECESLKEASK